ncbi:AMP-binding protein, partial [Frankia tisae]|uniref:AMP-binding protein n=1 Tax=Frankia tisae TaxID=2950104 RepID=UPI0021C1B7CA
FKTSFKIKRAIGGDKWFRISLNVFELMPAVPGGVRALMSLIDWIDGDDHGLINFYSHGGWEGTDFDDLAKSVCAAAELFVSAGIRRGDRVALVLPTGREFFDRFFGALAIGAIPTVLPTPGIGGQEFCDTHLA